MPRKDSQRTPEHRGFNDIIGVVLLGLALLLFIAMVSFDRNDVAVNTTNTNVVTNNSIGLIGAYVANFFFKSFGVGAYALPVLLALFGLGYLLDLLSYLRRRWAWGIVLLLCLVGVLALYTDSTVVRRLATNPRTPAGVLETAAYKLNSGSAGGVTGMLLNDILFGYFGRPGATIVYGLLDVVSLLF